MTKADVINHLHSLQQNKETPIVRHDLIGSGVSPQTVDQLFGSFNNAMSEAGITTARQARHKIAVSPRKGSVVSQQSEEQAKIIPPEIPEDDIPVEEQIEILKKRFIKRKENHDAQKWMPFKVSSNKPIAICWFGDPHVDDNGCNWPLLGEHIDIIKSTPGMYGANIGDTHNNWVGRLGVLYAHQDTSRSTALKLAQWFVEDSGVKWLIWLLGNHDAWNFGSEVMSKITHKITMKDWSAQFKLVFPNGREVLFDAAHNHKGHSQWNPLHGQQKASVMGGVAHVYMAGHLHNWGLAQHECPFTNRIYWLCRARGYKHIDDYADKGGFGSQKSGSAIVTVIDPTADEVNLVRCFADVKEAAEYLTFLRTK